MNISTAIFAENVAALAALITALGTVIVALRKRDGWYPPADSGTPEGPGVA